MSEIRKYYLKNENNFISDFPALCAVSLPPCCFNSYHGAQLPASSFREMGAQYYVDFLFSNCNFTKLDCLFFNLEEGKVCCCKWDWYGNSLTITFVLMCWKEHVLSGSASELGRQISADPKTPGGPGSCSTIAEEAVDQLQENEKLVAGQW